MKRLLLLTFVLLANINYGQSQLNLMPWPKDVEIGEDRFIIKPDFTISIKNNQSDRLTEATTKFLRRLSGRTGIFIDQGFAFGSDELNKSSLEVEFSRKGELKINEDESYRLEISKNKILISSQTDIGALHGLETLLQLVDHNQTDYFFPEIIITDAPRFTWRGLMIDAARHFQPVAVIKRNLDAMAAVKLNVLHWHLTDDQGFRVESKTHPKLHELGSDGQYYTQNQIKDVVKYASLRGIRVVPEFDVPGHATAILTAYPEIASKDTTYTIERFAGIFHATIDPTNERTYEILGELFGEMSSLFPDRFFHIGGDENEGKHWDQNEKIQAFKKRHNLKTNHDLQTHFNIRLEEMLSKHGKSVMGWEEIMTEKMPKTALIHSWRGVNEGVPAGQSLVNAAKKGYNTVLSNGFYIDLMQPVTEHYLVDPLPNTFDLTPEERSRILGGEATMWSELVTPLSIDSRIWPRTAAIAERFWSPSTVRDIGSMYKRLDVTSFRLEELGITHMRNRDVILRNITNNQNIEALVKLTKVYEPLKIYTRNKGGTEYKSFSPFTLFADACSADASEAIIFNQLVRSFLESENESTKKDILKLLNSWVENDQRFSELKIVNPILLKLQPLSNNLGNLSRSLIHLISSDQIEKGAYEKLGKQYLTAMQPVEDVELATLKSMKQLIEHFSKKSIGNFTPKTLKIQQ